MKGNSSVITRRSLMVAGLAAVSCQARAAAPPPGIPPGGRIAFEVFRNDSRIGTHTLDFTTQGTAISVAINVRFAVGIGPLVLYRYTMQGTEHWVDGRFDSLETETNDDGTQRRVTARRTADGISIRSLGEPDQQLQAGALPLTHWSMANMTAPLFNPQNGLPITEAVIPKGTDSVKLPTGTTVQARHFLLPGAMPIEDWYDDNQRWVKLTAKGKDGSAIDYRLS